MFRVAVNAAPIAMLMVDEEGQIALSNRKAEELFEYTAEELSRLGVDQLLPADARAGHPKLRRQYGQAPAARAMGQGRDLFCLTKSGREVAIEIGLTPVVSDDKRYVISSILDITERKKTEAVLRANAEELSKSNRNLEEFNYAASHDLRAPLRHIASFATLLKTELSQSTNEKVQRWLQVVVQSTERMKVLLDDLMEYSRSGYGSINHELVDLQQTVKETLADLSVLIQETGADVLMGSLPQISGDAVKIRQVLQNLIQNAIKFRRPGVQPIVRVEAHEDADAWLVMVRDNGKGIPKEFHQRLFKPFQRLDRDRNDPGYGMGLAICKRIAEMHGGSIVIESVEGEGSTFIFSIAKRKPSTQDGRNP